MKKILIIGAGWLGFPLAMKLTENGHDVHTTTTTPEKKETLESNSIKCSIFNAYKTALNTLAWTGDVIIITIPFKRNLEDPFKYTTMVDNICTYMPKKTLIIFTSSTSVYPKHIENCTENTHLAAPRSQREIALHETECIIQSHPNHLILRLSGLYGPDREPGKFLARKTCIPDQPVNLIHLDDTIEIMQQLINKNISNEIFNLTQDMHPLKSDFYTLVANKNSMAAPEFTHSKYKKIVSNQKIKDTLNYNFIHPNPMAGI